MKKILCIDDHPRLLSLYQQDLFEDGHQVVLPEDGKAAPLKFVKEKPEHRSAQFLFFIQATGTVLLLLLMNPGALFGQMIDYLETGQGPRISASAASSYQFKSDATGGGDFSVSRYSLMLGGSAPVDERIRLGLGLSYDFEDYNFSNLKGFPVSNPWSKIDRVGLGARLSYKLGENWGLRVGSIVQYAGERGADFGDSLMYGGMIAASYRVSRDFIVGFGVGVYYRLEETRVFPSLMISWKITDRLRLGNSYRLGPTGPAGLELTYMIDKNWQLGVGGGYRSSRFRLDSNGPIPGGIGENDSWPFYVRLSRRLWQTVSLDLFGGAAFGGKLRLDDRGGNEINSVSYNTTPLAGLTLRALF